jgi:hypothetical protein
MLSLESSIFGWREEEVVDKPYLKYFPIGNADSALVWLKNDRVMLFDFGNQRPKDAGDDDKRVDLAEELRDDMEAADKDAFDVVAFTHLDDDHICGASDFFWLDFASKYQGDGRYRISELWVPAAVIVDDQCEDEAKTIQSEARYRLKHKTGIRVFARPASLVEWLEKNGLTLDEVKHLITDAGNVIPGFTTEDDGIEVFVHSPFAAHHDDELVDKNRCSLMLHATFTVEGEQTRTWFTGDAEYDVVEEIVQITRARHREERLQWDVFGVLHHTSYRALSDEKGKEKTQPVADVDWLFKQGNDGGIIVSTSNTIPVDDTDQPPHRQAANYYKDRAVAIGGDYVVTMAHPNTTNPEPLVISISRLGAKVEKKSISGAAAIVSHGSSRFGAPRG